jgi:hypothetical protein
VADEASVGGPTGNGATEATAFSPALGPALALVDSRGVVVRLTDTFRAGFAPEGSPHLSIWDFLPDPDQRSRLGRVLEGRLLRADLALPSPTGSVNAEAEAVLDAAVMRHALLTVAAAQPEPDPRSGADVLLDDGSVIDSPAIVWITDLSGRYLRINRRYAQRLGIKDADILGKTDAELSPAHVVAEPRSVRHGDRGEPAQLEYTVDAVGRREALTVLRFPLHGLNGAAVAVCGVASSVADAATARSEAERLLRLERWAGLSAAAIRAELIQEWELAELAESEAPSEAPAPLSRARPAEPAAATAELERMSAELAAVRESAAELQALLEEHAAARAALEAQLEAQTPGRAELETQLASESAARAELETQLASESAERAELETQLASQSAARAELETQLVEETARSAELRTAAAAAARRADEIVSGVATEHSRIAELQTALDAQRRRAEGAEREVGLTRGRADVADREIVEARGRAEAAEREVAVERSRADAAEREAGEARARIDATDRDLAAARARIGELERAGAQSSEATEQVNTERAARTELEHHVAEAQRRAHELEQSLAAERAEAARLREELTARAERAEAVAGETRAAGQQAVADEIERARATSSAAVDQANAERAARAQLEQQALEAQRRVQEAEQILAAERAEAAWARGELVGRAERAEMAVADARAAGERAAALVQRAEAAAELARGRAEGLETTLASAREGESENRMASERARAEIANLQAALEQARAENETVREAAREATERLERELAARDAAAAAADAARAPQPPPPVIGPPETGTAVSRPGPSWNPDAQRALTSSLAQAAEWRTGLKDAIRVLGTEAGWDVVIAWCPDERGRALRCVAMWMSAPAGLSLFETATWQRRQSPTASLAGRAAVGDRASWFGDLSAVSDAQLAAAAGEGMEGALLVPMRQGEESIGVLELLTRRPAAPAPEVATAMEAVALQLAHFECLLRRGAEPRWRLGRL